MLSNADPTSGDFGGCALNAEGEWQVAVSYMHVPHADAGHVFKALGSWGHISEPNCACPPDSVS